MTSHVVVIDTSFRRATVKVTPGIHLADVLEEACQKLGLEAPLYSLKNNNKTLDLSQTFRQSNLSSGAKLELVLASRTPRPVSVALQLPEDLASVVPGGRLTAQLPSNTTIWLVLRKLESMEGINLNFTARGVSQDRHESTKIGPLFYEQPELNIVGRRLGTFKDLQKTLGQLGFNSGTCLIRLGFKNTDLPLEEAMKNISEYFKDEISPNAEKRSIASSNSETNLAKLPMTSEGPAENIAMAVKAAPEDLIRVSDSESLPNPKSSMGQRLISIYSPPSGQTPKAASIPYDDADYEPTVAHAKLHQRRLLNSSQNKHLLSEAELEELEQKKALKLANVREVTIKVRFPDQSSAVSTFTADETGSSLYAFVVDLIVCGEEPFKLIWHKNDPQTIPNSDKKLIQDLGLDARTLVNFLWEKGAAQDAGKPILKSQYAQKAKELLVHTLPEINSLEGITTQEHLTNDIRNEKTRTVGKWFKGLGNR